MAKPVESFVKATLAKNGRNAKLLAAVEYGWARWTVHPDHLKFRRGATRASLVWEASVDKAIELFAGDSGVHVVEHFSYHVGQITYIAKSRKAVDLGYYAGVDLNVTR